MKKILVVNTPSNNKDFFGGPKTFTSNFEKNIITLSYELIFPRNNIIVKNKFLQLFYLIYSILKEKPDVIIITTFGFHIIPTILIGKYLEQSKIIGIIHSLKKVSYCQKESFRLTLRYLRNSVLRNFLEKLLLNNSDYNIFPSKLLLEKSKDERYEIKNSVVIHHGVSDDIIKNHSLEQIPNKVISIIGSFLQIKGTDRLEMMLKALPDDYSLQWIGYDKNDILQRIEVQSWVKKKNNNLKIIDKVDSSDVIKYIDSSAIILVPSIFESFGLAALESCARAIPVIVSDNCGVTEILKDSKAGEIISFDDSKELEWKINKIINNYPEYSNFALQLANANKWTNTIRKYGRIVSLKV